MFLRLGARTQVECPEPGRRDLPADHTDRVGRRDGRDRGQGSRQEATLRQGEIYGRCEIGSRLPAELRALARREKKQGVHWSNGVRALPETYDLHPPGALTPYVCRDLVLTEEDVQDLRIEVPVGHVIVRYLKADGSAQRDERCWISRLQGQASSRGKLKQSGRKVPLLPGSYQLKGWS